MTDEKRSNGPVKVEQLSFTVRTVVSLGLNVIVGVIFLMKMGAKVEQLGGLVDRMERANDKRDTEVKLYMANKDAKDATQDIQLNTLENRLDAFTQTR